MDLWEGQLSIMRMRDFRYRPPYTMVHGEATDEPSEVVRRCEANAADPRYTPEWQNEWAFGADYIGELLERSETHE